MIKLVVSRYFEEHESEHPTFEHAVITAIAELDNDASYPLRILNGEDVLWEHTGGDALMFLRNVASKAVANKSLQANAEEFRYKPC
jgi:hypothetical protein